MANGFELEGATADTFEVTLTLTDPTADATWTVPNFAVNAAFVGSTLTTNNIDAANSVWAVSNGLVLEGATADGFETTVSLTDPTADRTVTIPNKDGEVMLASTCSALSSTAGAISLVIGLGNCFTYTVTDNQDETITFSGAGSPGTMITIIFQTDAAGAQDEVVTFHTTLTSSVGTLTLANLASQRYVVTFMSDGTIWNEIARTAVQPS